MEANAMSGPQYSSGTSVPREIIADALRRGPPHGVVGEGFYREKLETILLWLTQHRCGVAQRQPEPAMWVCLVTPKGEHEEPHIRAWTTSAERAKRFAQLEGLEMRPLYASPVPSTALGGEAK
jgi:hypothetical protein